MKEIRSIESSEFRIVPSSRKVEGYALLFNKESNDLGGFKEVIKPESLNGVLERSDILALYNHNENSVLARSTNGSGTLMLEVDEKGLKYSFNAPQTQLGDEIYSAIQRGDLRNSSFAFTLSDSGQKWEKRDGSYLRTITQFDMLYDVSPVWRPAYSDTSVALRSIELLDKKELEDRMIIEVEVKVSEVENEDTLDNEDILEPIEPEMEPVEPNDPMMEQNLDPTEDPNEVSDDLIDIVYDGETYSIPKSLIEDYVNDRKLENYFVEIETSISQLKK